MTPQTPPKPEFSRLVRRDRLADGESLHEIEATAEEREALAERFDLLSLDRLWASLQVRPAGRKVVRVSGRFEAELAQACVVTLEPVRSRLAEDVELLYSLAPQVPEEEVEVIVTLEEEETPEPVGAEGLDLGEAVAQQLAVSLDPYPRCEGVALEDSEWPQRDEAEADEGPFRALRPLKRRG